MPETPKSQVPQPPSAKERKRLLELDGAVRLLVAYGSLSGGARRQVLKMAEFMASNMPKQSERE